MPPKGSTWPYVAIALVAAAGASGLALAAKPVAQVGALTMKEYMNHVIGYAAGNVWRWQGWSTDASGEVSLFPKNEAQWDEAENAALTLVALGDGLIANPDRKNRREWLKTAREMKAAAQEAADTALFRDEDKFFSAGARLYDACRDCHRSFLPKRRPGSAAP